MPPPEASVTNDILHLWPTVLMNRIVPGHEAANQALLTLIETLDKEKAALTTDYLDDNFLAREEPQVAWLKRCVDVTVRDYFAHQNMNYSIRWTLQGWANVNRFTDYHDYHNHPHAYLSGTYYVQCPTDVEPLAGRDDRRSGCLTLYDPRASANMLAIKGDPNIEAEHTIAPRPGMIVLWPAFVNHFVHPNLSKQHRISVSFNVLLKWSNEYLPTQR